MDDILTVEWKDELKKLGNDLERIEWRIGEIAREAWIRNKNVLGGKYYKYQVFSQIARRVGCSKGRVEKLWNMAEFYPPEIRQRYPGYHLGHFEEAMNFGPDEAPDVLEFIGLVEEETGQLPRVNDVDWLYRRNIRGQPTHDELTGRQLNRHTEVQLLEEKIINLIKSIKGLITEKPLPPDRREKLEQGLELIREALSEVDEGEVVHYN